MNFENVDNETHQEYWVTLQQSGYFLLPEPGCLRFDGEDRYTFLNRQTTNNVNLLQPIKSMTTILSSPTGRILDVLILIDRGEHIMALTLPAHRSNTFRYLRNHIFFMDKVNLSDISNELVQISLDGSKADQTLGALGLETPRERDEVVEANFQGSPLLILEKPGLVGRGFVLLAAAEKQTKLTQSLQEVGAINLSPESHNILRVEAGLPGADAELSEAYTPLEVGMEQAVSGNKGCYPGQEVIARQITYGKVTQQLAGFRLETPLETGASLYADDKPVGKITSTAVSPRYGLIALGVVKRPYHQVGTVLYAQAGQIDHPARAVVAPLPFTNDE